jgi:hypothetical protein
MQKLYRNTRNSIPACSAAIKRGCASNALASAFT